MLPLDFWSLQTPLAARRIKTKKLTPLDQERLHAGKFSQDTRQRQIQEQNTRGGKPEVTPHYQTGLERKGIHETVNQLEKAGTGIGINPQHQPHSGTEKHKNLGAGKGP